MIKPTPEADQLKGADRADLTPDRPSPRRAWQTPRLERADLSATRFGGTVVFDGSDFDLTSFPL